MKDYKQWTGKQREASLKFTNTAIRLGIIEPAKMCCKCSQTEGIIQLHCEDYDFTTQVLPYIIAGTTIVTDKIKQDIANALWPLCWRCHMIYHSNHRAPDACKKYWQEVEEGKTYPPVYKHNFAILSKEHGIF